VTGNHQGLNLKGAERNDGDPLAVDFGKQCESSPKETERQIAAMAAAMLSGAAA
jgi:hypothetical protein